MNPPKTLLSFTQKYRAHAALPNTAPHPFSKGADAACSLLQELANKADDMSHSLNAYMSMPISNPKFVSLLREQSSLSSAMHLSDNSVQQLINALRGRSLLSYGEDVPLEKSNIAQWCVARLEAWGTSAGMETFVDYREGGVSLTLGGKVLVVDVDLAVGQANSPGLAIDVTGVKTSYAVQDGVSGSTKNSASLDGLLLDSIGAFLLAAQRPAEVLNPRGVAKLGARISGHLSYLVMLDRLATRSKDGGIRWFLDVDELSSIVEDFAKRECEAVSLSLSLSTAPLDIFLLRGHALPLPFFVSPSLSFLVYLSPMAYLTLYRNTTPCSPKAANLPLLDIPFSRIRSYLATARGATVANLVLQQSTGSSLFPPSLSMQSFSTRPSFPLSATGANIDHAFPQIMETSMTEAVTDCVQYEWVLDFTSGEDSPGVVMTQSRMREIELVLNPLNPMDHMNSVNMMTFGASSWVNLLLNSGSPVSSERYTAFYRSPTSAHPPLQLRLTAPEEPGFLLERVRVHSLKEIWGILEVVREQCWLNEILRSCQWQTEGVKTNAPEELQKEDESTEDELQVILNGTMIPRKIPVNVYIPSETFFDPADLDSMSVPHTQTRRPRIVMTSPERPPISGLVEISVIYDETRPRGVRVDVSGAMGADIRPDVLEETCRRGGTLGLAGKIWANSHAVV